jgi:tripartite-type tricarboxylate transporter receptor subunit TctC
MANRTKTKVAMHVPLRAAAAFLAALFFAAHAGEQAWPAQPIKMIVARDPGAAALQIAYVICPYLSGAFRVPVLPESPQGEDAVQLAASAKPDGYTLLLAPASALVISPYITDLVPYSPEDDFAGVAMVGSTPFVVVANPALNVKSLRDLVALAREAPGRLAYASPGPRAMPGILGEMLCKRTGIEPMTVLHGGAQSVRDTVAGRTHFSVESVPAIATAVQRGQLRALAVSSAKRLPELKDVPTLAEVLPGFEFSAWYAVVAPSGTPDEVVQRVNLAISRVLADPTIELRLNLLGIYPEGTPGPAQVDAFFASERAFWQKTARELRLAPD